MLPLLTNPLALWGLLAIPTLAGIYLLRSRASRLPVSSLMLWMDLAEARDGGPKVDRLQLPWLFFIELLILLLLAIAAASPQWHVASAGLPVIVVLDDSFSMLAGDPDSPRSRAEKAIEKELGSRLRSSVRFVLAGEKPQLLGESVRTVTSMRATLQNWKCRASQANINDAIAFATNLASERSLILVVTDHGSPNQISEGRLEWWSFGKPLPNIAIVNAQRSQVGEVDRVLLEVANLASESKKSTLTIQSLTTGLQLQRMPIEFEPNQLQRKIFQLPKSSGTIEALIEPDDLPIDDRVLLMPVGVANVRVDVKIQQDGLRKLVEKAIDSPGNVTRTAIKPDLIITDTGSNENLGETWQLIVQTGDKPKAFTGPFVLDRSNPLTEGLVLPGTVWGIGEGEELPGNPLILAGNTALLSEQETATGRIDLYLRFRADVSTFQDTPNWPILFWNLAQYRMKRQPGLVKVNLRLGEEAIWTLPEKRAKAELLSPDGSVQPQSIQGKRIVVTPTEVGKYRLRAEDLATEFSVNALSRDESDLKQAETSRMGSWLDETTVTTEYRPITWILLLIALAFFLLHSFLLARGPAKVQS
jgi:hypothetical protein